MPFAVVERECQTSLLPWAFVRVAGLLASVVFVLEELWVAAAVVVLVSMVHSVEGHAGQIEVVGIPCHMEAAGILD